MYCGTHVSGCYRREVAGREEAQPPLPPGFKIAEILGYGKAQ